jgi:hypothetical protein
LLADVVESGSTLAKSLVDFHNMRLIAKHAKIMRPIQTEYLLAKKGNEVASSPIKLQVLLFKTSDNRCETELGDGPKPSLSLVHYLWLNV